MWSTWRRSVLAVGISLLVFVVVAAMMALWYSRRRRRSRSRFSTTTNQSSVGPVGLDLAATEQGMKLASRWRELYPFKPFSWLDNPALASEAMGRGWAAVAFTYSCSSRCPVSASAAVCSKCCLGEALQPEVSWEIGPGSDFMQLIRLNPKLPETDAENARPGMLVQAIQSALPLPGPSSERWFFPREGYVEFTVVAVGVDELVTPSDSLESDNIKLILKPSPSDKYPLSLAAGNGLHAAPTTTKAIVQARIQAANQLQRHQQQRSISKDETGRIMGLGFSAGVAPPFMYPGTYPGSVGLLSDGYIFLNGKLHRNSLDPTLPTTRGWRALPNTTIGCGYSPQMKRVFFTLNGEIIGEVKTSKDFNSPVYAVVAANYDVAVLVNFGQCSFEFTAANDQRAADSSTVLNGSNSLKSVATYDSGDLFSIQRLDSHWWSGRRTTPLSQPDADDCDLFEIPLDGRG